MGITFPIVSRIFVNLETIGKDIGNVFSVNTTGALFGAFTAGFIFIPVFGLEKTILIAAIANIRLLVYI